MRLAEVTIDRKQDYQSFVQANGYFLQYWQWGDFQESVGEKVSRYILSDEQGVQLCAQGLTRKLRGKEYIFFPYGPVVSATAEKPLEVLQTFCQELKKQNSHLIFARVEPFIKNENHVELISALHKKFQKSIDLDPHKTLVLDLTKNIEDLQIQMHPKTRYNIKVAEKKNVEVKVLDAKDSDIDAAVGLLLATSARAGIRGFTATYYANLFKAFAEQPEISAKMYLAFHEGDLLAANLMIYFHDTAVYLFGGSASEKRNFMAPYLLHFRAISDAKVRGLSRYDFWGIETDPNHPWHGFSRFKAGFGGKTIDYLGTWDYVFKSPWYNVYKFLRKLNRLIRR